MRLSNDSNAINAIDVTLDNSNSVKKELIPELSQPLTIEHYHPEYFTVFTKSINLLDIWDSKPKDRSLQGRTGKSDSRGNKIYTYPNGTVTMLKKLGDVTEELVNNFIYNLIYYENELTFTRPVKILNIDYQNNIIEFEKLEMSIYDYINNPPNENSQKFNLSQIEIDKFFNDLNIISTYYLFTSDLNNERNIGIRINDNNKPELLILDMDYLDKMTDMRFDNLSVLTWINNFSGIINNLEMPDKIHSIINAFKNININDWKSFKRNKTHSNWQKTKLRTALIQQIENKMSITV